MDWMSTGQQPLVLHGLVGSGVRGQLFAKMLRLIRRFSTSAVHLPQ
jgi:hypothetical protein